MADVFISYAHEDQAIVKRMALALEAEGLSVWWDHTIPPGQTWDTHIARGIKEARACIVVWSQNSVGSDWVKEEASIGRDGGKYLPAQIDAATPPMGFSRIQAAQLAGWEGDRNDAQWQLLLREVRKVLDAGPATPAPSPGAQAGASKAKSKRRGAPFVSMAVGVVALIGAGAGGYWFGRGACVSCTSSAAQASTVVGRWAGMAEQTSPATEGRSFLLNLMFAEDGSVRDPAGLDAAEFSGPIEDFASFDGVWSRDGAGINFEPNRGGRMAFEGTVSDDTITGTWSEKWSDSMPVPVESRPRLRSGTFRLTRQ